METPSSTRRITRSQAMASANSNNNNKNIPMSRKFDDTENGASKTRQRTGKQNQERSALIDITNDSPIVGLAMGNLDTPSSNFLKRRFNVSSSKHMNTPGSGEDLLRGQVKTLLQKVEEEAVLSKIPVEYRQFLNHHGIVSSPMAFLAPTPANTPQVSDFSGSGNLGKVNDVLASVAASPVEEQFNFSLMMSEIIGGKRQEESVESEKNLITRTLFSDFSEKTEDSVLSDCTSELTYQEECSEVSKENKSSAEDDDASVWSIQVNASTQDDEEDSELDSNEDEYYEDDEGEYVEEGDGDLVDGLCEGISKINVNGAEFTGKHIRFVYNSDDEFEGEIGDDDDDEKCDSCGILRLRGLPTPKGKHLRFPDEEE